MSKEQECTGCKNTKPSQEFRKNQPVCKSCETDPTVDYIKECNVCGENKNRDQFRHNRLKCKDCEREHGRNYRRQHGNNWGKENPERMQELQRKHYDKNKPQIRQKERERYHNDADYRYIRTFRLSLSNLLKGNKNSTILKIDRTKFIEWLEYSFDEGMTIDNYATEWQNDHVLPLALLYENNKSLAADIVREEETREALFGWWNTCPLTIKDNRNKGSKITSDVLLAHIDHLDKFLKMDKIFARKTRNNKHYQIYRKTVQRILDEAL